MGRGNIFEKFDMIWIGASKERIESGVHENFKRLAKVKGMGSFSSYLEICLLALLSHSSYSYVDSHLQAKLQVTFFRKKLYS